MPTPGPICSSIVDEQSGVELGLLARLRADGPPCRALRKPSAWFGASMRWGS